jgi:hypothetical protein
MLNLFLQLANETKNVKAKKKKLHDRNKMTKKLKFKKTKNVEFQNFLMLKKVMMKGRQTCSFNLELEICIKRTKCECVA